MYANEVCLFGDSIARGVILDACGSYKPIRESFAFLAASELGFSLINKARFGCTIAKGREIIERFLGRNAAVTTCSASLADPAGISRAPSVPQTATNIMPENTSPNVAIHIRTDNSHAADSSRLRLAFLEFGGNDCDFRWDEISADPHREHLPATTPERFFHMYGEVLQMLKQNGFKPVLMTLPPLNAERYFAWFTRAGLDQAAILSWLGDVQFIYRWHESYSSAIWEIGEAHNVPVVNIRKAFLEQRNYSRFLCKDGIHPNTEGHRLITSEIIKFAQEHMSV